MKFLKCVRLVFVLLFAQQSNIYASYSVDQLMHDIHSHWYTTIEDVISQLPGDLKKNYALQHHGGGLQEASYENPRAILYGVDAKFVLTFNGDASQKMHDSLELMQFNDEHKKFEFYTLDFQKNGELPRLSEKNPSQCMKCHSVTPNGDPFPVWGRYPFWRGSYGENDDRFVGNELTKFEAFRKSWDAHPLYKNLKRKIGSPQSPYSDENNQSIAFRPNANLGSLLVRLTAIQISEQIRKTPEFEKYLLLTTPSFFSCWGRLDKDSLAKLDERLKTIFEQDGFQTKPVPSAPYWATENVAYLLGSSAYSWGLLPAAKLSLDGVTAVHSKISDPYFLDGYFLTTPNYILALLREDFFKKYPELKSHYKLESIADLASSDKGRLLKTDMDYAVVEAIDRAGHALSLKSHDCNPVLNAVRREFLK